MEEKDDGTIYIWINLVSPKKYVGQTTRALKKRIREHINGSNGSLLLHQAINKYGIENFKVISFSCPEKDLDWTEGFLETALNTIAPNGYNLMLNEHQHKRHNKITKQKMRDNHWDNSGENHPSFGTHPTEATIQKQSKAKTGEKNSMFGRTGENNPSFGKKRPEHSKAMSGKNNPMFGDHRFVGENNPNARPVILISPEGIEYKLPCYKPFCREHDLNIGNIYAVLHGKRKHHKGWTGRYIDK